MPWDGSGGQRDTILAHPRLQFFGIPLFLSELRLPLCQRLGEIRRFGTIYPASRIVHQLDNSTGEDFAAARRSTIYHSETPRC